MALEEPKHSAGNEPRHIPADRSKVQKALDRLVALLTIDLLIQVIVALLAVFPALEALGVLHPGR